MAIAYQTATATLWTHTPTPDNTQTVAAILTEFWQGTATAIAASWTETATPTNTPTNTLMPSVTPTSTATMSVEQLALTPQTSNEAWKPTIMKRDFEGVTIAWE